MNSVREHFVDSAYDSEHDAEVVCCDAYRDGNGYVHPVAVVVNAGGQITRIDDSGTHMSAGEASGRGVRIAVDFVSEHEGHFRLVLQFHKGCTYAHVEDYASSEDVSTIWRD